MRPRRRRQTFKAGQQDFLFITDIHVFQGLDHFPDCDIGPCHADRIGIIAGESHMISAEEDMAAHQDRRIPTQNGISRKTSYSIPKGA
jgi:hypothetical protein